MKNIFLIVGILFFLFPAQPIQSKIFTDRRAGTTTAPFLKLGVGARAVGMGEAYGAVGEGVDGAYWNPAGLNQLKTKAFSLMHLSWLEDIGYNYLGFALPLKIMGRRSVLGGAVNYLSMGEIEIKRESVPMKNIKPYQGAATISYAQEIAAMMFGLNAKIIRQEVNVKKPAGWALDLGFLYKNMEERWAVGLTGQNMGTKIRFIEEADPLPLNIKLGTMYRLPIDINSLTVALDFNFPVDYKPNIHCGTEYAYNKIKGLGLTGRLGFRSENISDLGLLSGIAAGGGMAWNNLSLDYAYTPCGSLGDTHWLSLGLRLGNLSPSEKQIETLFNLGKQHYAQGELVSAQEEFTKVLNIDPGHHRSKKFLEKIAQLLETSTDLNNLYNQGFNYYNKGEFKKALEIWNWLLVLSPGHEGVKKYLPLAQEKIKRKEEAEQKKSIEERIKHRCQEGLTFYQKGLFLDAIDRFKDALKLEPEHREAQKYIFKAQNQLAQIYFNKGLTFFNKGELDEAIGQFEIALRYNPKFAKVQTYLAESKKRVKEAKQKEADYYYEMGLKKYREADLDEAIKCWQKALEYNPQGDKTKQAIERAVKENQILKKRKANEFYEAGIIKYRQGDLAQAITIWQKALLNDPNHEKAKIALDRANKELKLLKEQEEKK